MKPLRGYFQPTYHAKTIGFSKEGGEFWIGFIDEQDLSDGVIRIDLTISADDAPTKNSFVSISVHYDGIKVLRKLDELGFLEMFEEIKASTFYDVVQCCSRCDIPIEYHSGDYTKEMTPRKIYEMLYQ